MVDAKDCEDYVYLALVVGCSLGYNRRCIRYPPAQCGNTDRFQKGQLILKYFIYSFPTFHHPPSKVKCHEAMTRRIHAVAAGAI